jgi:predicted phosphodiesterase
VATLLLSDLHLGTRHARDVLRRPEARERLIAALDGADEVVLLGDAVELRECPAREALDIARPFLRALGAAVPRVVVVPGNHDHQLAAPWLDARRLNGAGPLDGEPQPATGQPGLLGAVADALAPAEVLIAYPGYRVRDDVWATHGHYLDCHMTVPRVECIAVSVMQRLAGHVPDGPRTAEDYEHALAPLYAISYQLAQGSGPARKLPRENPSAVVWRRLQAGGPAGKALEKLAIPASVALANTLGLGPFVSDLSGPALRRAGLRAMEEVLAGLGVEAQHIVFGHTHRPGPLASDDGTEWGRLVNCGSWLHEPAFLDGAPEDSPYWPGTLVRVDATGPPRVERVLEPRGPRPPYS